jgi:class 3 adenylate cyclase
LIAGLALTTFDLYARENALIEEAVNALSSGSVDTLDDYAKRLLEQLKLTLSENQQLVRHADRQQAKLVDLNRNLKLKTKEVEQRGKAFEELSIKLSKYLPPQIHKALFSGQHDAKVATQRKKLTVFFSDIKEFTTSAESLQPEALTEYLNEYFSEMTKIALEYGATIDKYIGDAMMLFFGDPESKGVAEDAVACVEMAVKMQSRMRVLGEQWKKRGFETPFVIRIGINTGYCNVGNFGSEERLSYTIIGGEVNIAQRLESNAEPGGILMSYETYAHVKHLYQAEEKPSMHLKGISREIKTFALRERIEAGQETLQWTHPAGVQIKVSPENMDSRSREELASQLADIARQLGQYTDSPKSPKI